MQLQTNSSHRLAIAAETGHHTPCSGWWGPENDPLAVRYLQRGEIMPALRGSQTVWTLLRERTSSPQTAALSTDS